MVLESRSCGTKTQPKFVSNLVVITVGGSCWNGLKVASFAWQRKCRKLITVKTYQYVLLALGGNVKLQYEPCSKFIGQSFPILRLFAF